MQLDVPNAVRGQAVRALFQTLRTESPVAPCKFQARFVLGVLVSRLDECLDDLLIKKTELLSFQCDRCPFIGS